MRQATRKRFCCVGSDEKFLVSAMASFKRREFAMVFFLVVILASMLGGAIAHRRPLDFHLGRNLLQENSSESLSVLSERTRRIDPLEDFKKYKGGYNITDKHYWSSTIFTGRYGYGIAVLWLIVGLVFAMILLVFTIFFKKSDRRTKRVGSEKRYFWVSLFCIIFVLLAIVASGVVLGGSTKFHSAAKATKNTIEGTAQEAYTTIYNITEAVLSMQNVSKVFGDFQGISSLNSTSQNLDGEADSLQKKAIRNMHRLSKGINIMEVVTIITVTINLCVLLLLIGCEGPKFFWASQLLFAVFWVLTILFWSCFGLYYFLDKFSGDTCIAFAEYQQDPHNSSLGEILPCSDKLSDDSVLQNIGSGIHDIIVQLNANISARQSSFFPDLELVCNPFSGPPEYSYQPGNCSSNTIQVGDVPKILKVFACMNESDGGCQQGQFISPSDYTKIVVYSNSVETILVAYPSLEALVSCQVVKNAFLDVLDNQCGPLKKYARMTWASFAALAAVAVVFTLFWIVETCGGDGGARWKMHEGSVRPHATPTEVSEEEGLNRNTESS